VDSITIDSASVLGFLQYLNQGHYNSMDEKGGRTVGPLKSGNYKDRLKNTNMYLRNMA
jgi:hypothetical protein